MASQNKLKVDNYIEPFFKFLEKLSNKMLCYVF